MTTAMLSSEGVGMLIPVAKKFKPLPPTWAQIRESRVNGLLSMPKSPWAKSYLAYGRAVENETVRLAKVQRSLNKQADREVLLQTLAMLAQKAGAALPVAQPPPVVPVAPPPPPPPPPQHLDPHAPSAGPPPVLSIPPVASTTPVPKRREPHKTHKSHALETQATPNMKIKNASGSTGPKTPKTPAKASTPSVEDPPLVFGAASDADKANRSVSYRSTGGKSSQYFQSKEVSDYWKRTAGGSPSTDERRALNSIMRTKGGSGTGKFADVKDAIDQVAESRKR